MHSMIETKLPILFWVLFMSYKVVRHLWQKKHEKLNSVQLSRIKVSQPGISFYMHYDSGSQATTITAIDKMPEEQKMDS
jgi:hypothetical protein